MCLNVQTIGLFLWQYFSWGKDLTILLAMQNLVHRFGFLSDHRRQPHLHAAKDCAAAGHIIVELSFLLFIFKLLSYISLDPNSLLSTLLWISPNSTCIQLYFYILLWNWGDCSSFREAAVACLLQRSIILPTSTLSQRDLSRTFLPMEFCKKWEQTNKKTAAARSKHSPGMMASQYLLISIHLCVLPSSLFSPKLCSKGKLVPCKLKQNGAVCLMSHLWELNRKGLFYYA